MIVWIDRQLALSIHERLLAEHGGSNGVRDEGLLDSALAQPQQLHAYGVPLPDLADLAATLAYGISRNHPFVDGNKRTATMCCEAFIELNGATLEVDDADWFPIILSLAEGKLSQDEYAAWLRKHLGIRNHDSQTTVQEPTASYTTRRQRARA